MITFFIPDTQHSVVIHKDVDAIMKMLELPLLPSFRLECDQLPGLRTAIANHIGYGEELEMMTLSRDVSVAVAAGYIYRMLRELARLNSYAIENHYGIEWQRQ